MAVIEEVLVSARTFPNVFAFPAPTKIGDLEVQTSVQEVYTDRLKKTEHPIEDGAAAADHAYLLPSEIVIRCGWSNANPNALLSIITGFFRGGTMTKGDYVSGVYSRLLNLQQSREPLAITTSLRYYDSMLITALQVTRESKTQQILDVSATCEQLPIVSARSATLAPKENHADSASTAETQNTGTQQVTAAQPAPGGAAPSSGW